MGWRDIGKQDFAWRGRLALAALAKAQDGAPPPWAYVLNPGGLPPVPTDPALMHLPGSGSAFTRGQLRDRFHVPDWYPGQHPPMPALVAQGRKPDVYACGFCHLPNGQGRPENASLAGQPAAYIADQVIAMREGRRHSAQPGMIAAGLMLGLAKHATDAELKTAGAYFSKLPYRQWIRVVETSTVPKTYPGGTSMLMATPDGAREKLGDRIIEIPEDGARTELRDPNSGFVAYVPTGSIGRGAKLVANGGGALPCASCHGDDFKGVGDTPALAGRSPSYLVRQMYDIKHGARGGPAVEPMKPEVANLNLTDMVAIAAYLSSRKP